MITAHQSGNSNYEEAESIARELVVQLVTAIEPLFEPTIYTPTQQEEVIIHMLYRRFLTCVLLNFVSNVGQRRRYLHASSYS
jgi:hypothetical protein